MNKTPIKQARIADNGKYIIDSDDQRVEYDDSRIVHAWVIDNSPYAKRLMNALFEKYGRKFRAAGKTDAEVMKYAKQLCSGRECVPATAITGLTLQDIYKNREDDEITLYFSLNQEGPCQNGAWPVLWDTFGKRLNRKNVIFMAILSPENNFLGLADGHRNWIGRVNIVGHYLDEAENALRVVAQDVDSAMKVFQAEAENLIDSVKSHDRDAFPKALKRWAKNVARIPRRVTVKETPKVLIFGGVNLLFVNSPVKEYFIRQGVIPKVVDLAEFIVFLMSEKVMKYGLKKGFVTPGQQFRILPIFFDVLFKRKDRKEAVEALMLRLRMVSIEIFKKKLRRIMDKSNLMFDPLMSFPKLAREGHKHVSYIGLNETFLITGRYVCSVKDNVFDGLINLGSFNCQPAMNSQAVIRPMANASDIPYAAIDVEGPWITANHKKLLETIAVQAKRVREKKNITLL